MEDKIAQLENEINALKKRNQRVENDKAWEISGLRIGTICMITYLTTGTVLFLIGVKDFYLGAIVPVAGFFLSTLSVPALKKWWIEKYLQRKN